MNAQIKKGSILLGGGISGNSGTSETGTNENNNSSLYIYPSVGLAITENAIVGLNLLYNHNQNKNNGTKIQESNTYGADFFTENICFLVKTFICLVKGQLALTGQ